MTIRATATSTEQASTSTVGAANCPNQNVALGAGLGVPLGLALLSVALLAYRLLSPRRTVRGDQTTDVVHQHTDREKPSLPELSGRVITELPDSGKSAAR